jgi:magnesium transporter
MPTPNALLALAAKFLESDPASAARTLETLEEDQVVELLKALPPPLAAKVLRQLQVSYAAALLKDAEVELFQEIASGLDPQHAATIFMHLPTDARERLLNHIPEKFRRQIREHLTYPENSVGRMMTTSILPFRKPSKRSGCSRRNDSPPLTRT